MEMVSLGRNGPQVSRAGLGCMAFSGVYSAADDDESVATIHAAMEAGITLIDTGDFYGMGHNEWLLRRALQGKRQRAFVQVKFGAQRAPDGSWLGFDTRPAAVKTALAYTLQRLGTEYIDLYQPARLDPNVPIEDTVGAIADCVKKGWVRHIGLSEMGADTIRRAHAVHPISQLQIEYSLMSRSVEERILPVVRELGISITAYGILSRGLLSSKDVKEIAKTDFRAHAPRFQGQNLAKNQALVAALRALAAEKGTTAEALAVAWVASRGKDIIPLLGPRTRAQLTPLLAGLTLPLSADDLRRLEETVPHTAVAGERYAAPQMRTLDSEKR